MQKPIGTIIDPPNDGNTGGGIPTIKLDTSGVDSSQRATGDAGNDPEIIHGFESADPDTIRIAATEKRKPGRPRGSGGRSTAGIGTGKAATPDSLIDLTTLLVSIHQMGAALVGVEELAIDPVEADAYANAIRELAKHYPHRMNPKALAWMNLAAVIGGIYGTRIKAYQLRMKNERRASDRVVEMPKQATGTDARQPQPKQQPPQQPPAPPRFDALTPSQIWSEPTSGSDF